MKIVWVTNDIWYSKLLRFLFNEDSSHVGTVFNFDGLDLAVDINKPYGSLYSLKYWLNKYRIVEQVELTLPHDQEIQLLKIVADYSVMRPYDMGGYYYGMVWGLLHKLFKLPLPEINKGSDGTGAMCQEIIIPILKSQIVQATGIINGIFDFANMSPSMTRDYFKKITLNNPFWKWSKP